MKIAMIAMNGGSGGLMRYIQGLLEIPTEHEINVFCTEKLTQKAEVDAWASNVIVTKCEYARERGKEILMDKPLHPKLIEIVDAYNPDVVFFSNGWVRKGLEHYPNIMVLHNALYVDDVAFRQTLTMKNAVSLFGFRHIVRRSMRKADSVIFLSEKSKQDAIAKNIRFKNGEVIHFGLTENEFCEKAMPHCDKEVYKLVYVSAFWGYKNHESLLKALVELKQRGHKFEMHFVGAGPRQRESRIKEMVKQLQLENNVVFHGNVSHNRVFEMIDQADVFVYPSSVESTGLGVMEAMARGACVACSNKSCMQEILGDCGVYFNPNNSTEIMDVIEKLLGDAQKRTMYSMQGLNEVRKYSWKTAVEKTVEVFLNAEKTEG